MIVIATFALNIAHPGPVFGKGEKSMADSLETVAFESKQ
jgi:hypothetical protein